LDKESSYILFRKITFRPTIHGKKSSYYRLITLHLLERKL